MVTAVSSEILHSDEYQRDPFPVWRVMRHEHPIVHDEIDDVWALTRYDDVAEVFRDWETYSTSPYSDVFGPVIGRTLAEMDGTEHTTRRAILAPPFSGRRLDSYIELIENSVEALSKRLPPSGPVDALDRYISHIPVRVMAEILGFPEEDHELFYEMAHTIMAGLEGVEPALSRGIAAHEELGAYIDPLITQRMEGDGTDVISRIVNAEVEGHRIDREEIKTFVSLLVNAGGQTTSDAISALWWDLLTHPQTLDEVREDPTLLEAAFSETMRLDGPVVYEDRTTTRDVEWYGREIPAGSTVRAFMASANTDDEVFREPLVYDIHRKDLYMGVEKRMGVRTATEASHIGFGLGRHFCLGWHLARYEAVIATRPLLAMDRPRLAEGTSDAPVVHFLVRRLGELNIDYAAR